MLKLFILSSLSYLFWGCGAMANAVMWTVTDPMTTHPKNPEKVMVREESGDSVILKKYQIDGDTLYGYKEDYEEYKIQYSKVIKIEKYKARTRGEMDERSGFSQNQDAVDSTHKSRVVKKLTNAGMLALCLTSGMAVGAGVGYFIPLTGNADSSMPGADQFVSSMTGMIFGGIIGFLVYVGLKGDG